MISFIQKFINKYYRYPKAKKKEIERFGGKKAFKFMQTSLLKMKEKASDLAPITSELNGYDIYFLTGKNYLYQTLFCIKSLSQYINIPIRYVLVDDGSFDAELVEWTKNKLPNCRLVLQEEISAHLKEKLPENKFPILHKKRAIYPHIKKLTDIHTIPSTSKYKLVLDSDMLFLQNPVELVDWLKNPSQPIYMVDCAEAYGYSRIIMEQLCEIVIPELVNVGVIGLNSNAIDWTKLEYWVKILEEKEGACYYLEQALTAMLVAGLPSQILPKESYVVNPSLSEIEQPKAKLHHYVDLSKYGYFTQAWKKQL